MKNKNTYLVVDVETAEGMASPFIYDIAWTIVDCNGVELAKRNFLVEEAYTPETMKTAYYREKMVTFYSGQNITRLPFKTILYGLANDQATYKTNVFCAYNAQFDIRALRATAKRLGCPEWAEIVLDCHTLDLWLWACQTVLSQRQYKKTAKRNGWVSEKGNIRTNAECCYRYISGNPAFIESHTAAADVDIECDILRKLLKAKGRIPLDVIHHHPWRIVNG